MILSAPIGFISSGSKSGLNGLSFMVSPLYTPRSIRYSTLELNCSPSESKIVSVSPDTSGTWFSLRYFAPKTTTESVARKINTKTTMVTIFKTVGIPFLVGTSVFSVGG